MRRHRLNKEMLKVFSGWGEGGERQEKHKGRTDWQPLQLFMLLCVCQCVY
jgi:hypothetical protein